jgi:hypothetical protein
MGGCVSSRLKEDDLKANISWIWNKVKEGSEINVSGKSKHNLINASFASLVDLMDKISIG